MTKIIPEFMDANMKAAIAWGETHPKEMKLKECPFDFLDERWHLWQRAQYAVRLSKMTPEAQVKEYRINRHMLRKMSS